MYLSGLWRQIIFVLAVVLVGSCTTAPERDLTGAGSAPDLPNIVFILVDDMGSGDAGYLGSEIATPNIDALARSGMILDRAYSYPLCSPTRAALLTGRNPIELGIDGPLHGDAVLTSQVALLPQILWEAGYDTWMVGKWHLGNTDAAYWPQARGFDHFYGHLGGYIDFYTHVYLGGLDWQRNGTTLREEGHSTELLTREAIRLISQEATDQPFFLYLAYNAPHSPLQYPPGAEGGYAEISDMNRRVYAQMVTDLDAHIGEVIGTLRASGHLDDTLIIFSSDNGGNETSGADNGALRGGKGMSYEGGVRVPAMVSWPGVIPAGSRSPYPVFMQDWLPTLIEATGGDLGSRPHDGQSLWSMLTGGSLTREHAMIVGSPNSRAVYEWPYKLVRNFPRPQGPGGDGGAVRRTAVPDELYDVNLDPYEQTNLAANHPELVARLAQRLAELEQAAIAQPGPPATPPDREFMGEDGLFNFRLRLAETRPPWTDTASGR